MHSKSISIFLMLAMVVSGCSDSSVQPTNTIHEDTGVMAAENKSASTSKGNDVNNDTNGLPECVKTDCNCKDFKTKAEAQKVLDAFPNDPHKIDRNRDGKACDSLP